MSKTATYRIRVVKDDDAHFPFRWEMYAPQTAAPFLTSRISFRSDKAAVQDATAFLARSNKRCVVER